MPPAPTNHRRAPFDTVTILIAATREIITPEGERRELGQTQHEVLISRELLEVAAAPQAMIGSTVMHRIREALQLLDHHLPQQDTDGSADK